MALTEQALKRHKVAVFILEAPLNGISQGLPTTAFDCSIPSRQPTSGWFSGTPFARKMSLSTTFSTHPTGIRQWPI